MAISPTMSLMSDPAFAMFVTSAGLQEELALADAARRRNAINQALGIEQEQISDVGQENRKQIRGDQESRGVFRSGQTLERTAQSEKAQARASALSQLNAATQLGDIEAGFLSGQAQRQLGISQSALETLQRKLQEQGEDSIDEEVASLGGPSTNPLTGLPTVQPIGQTAPTPVAPDLSTNRPRKSSPTKYTRAF